MDGSVVDGVRLIVILTACAKSGWAVINGVLEQPPLQLPVRQVSYLGGVAGFLATAAAVYRGTGETVDVSELAWRGAWRASWSAGLLSQSRSAQLQRDVQLSKFEQAGHYS